MIYFTSGYEGQSRSRRSQEAIDNYEIPLSWFCKAELSNFQESDSNEQMDLSIHNAKPYPAKIFKLPVALWKYAAVEKVGASSWHHTGKYYRKTNHYNLQEIADYLYKHYKKIQLDYKKHKKAVRQKRSQKQAKPVWLAVIDVAEWGGSRRHPKYLGTDSVCGFIHKNWLIAFDSNQSRFNLKAGRVKHKTLFTNLNALKLYLGKSVNLTKFKAFLSKHHVHADRYSKDKYDNVQPYDKLNHLDQLAPNQIYRYCNRGLYNISLFSCLDKEGNQWNPQNLLKLLQKWNIFKHDKSGWHLTNKYNHHTNYEIRDTDGYYLYTPMFFNYLDNIMKKHGYKAGEEFSVI